MPLVLDEYVFAHFLVLTRVGACLTVYPGTSSARVPVRVRLQLALMVSLLITPVISRPDILKDVTPGDMLSLTALEILAGTALGLMVRIFLVALEFAFNAVSSFVGLSSLAHAADGEEMMPSLVSLITVFAVLLFLITDLHRVALMSVAASFDAVPIGGVLPARVHLREVVDVLASSFLLALQLMGPFLVYAIVINLAFGILGKFVPQIPSYFISMPFTITGGLLLLYFLVGQIQLTFNAALVSAATR